MYDLSIDRNDMNSSQKAIRSRMKRCHFFFFHSKINHSPIRTRGVRDMFLLELTFYLWIPSIRILNTGHTDLAFIKTGFKTFVILTALFCYSLHNSYIFL